MNALRYALGCRHGVALLQGPPGTGKTKTLLAILAAIYHHASRTKGEVGGLQKKILVCAPSNAAVDEIASRVLKEGLPRLDDTGTVARPSCIRVGNPKRFTRQEVLEISLEEALYKTGKEMDKQQKDDFFSKREDISSKLDALDLELATLNSLRQAEKVEAEFGDGRDRPIARKFEDLLKQKRFLHQQKVRLKEEFEKQWKTSKATTRDSMLRDADIVFATLSSSATEALMSIEFECVITGGFGKTSWSKKFICCRRVSLGKRYVSDEHTVRLQDVTSTVGETGCTASLALVHFFRQMKQHKL